MKKLSMFMLFLGLAFAGGLQAEEVQCETQFKELLLAPNQHEKSEDLSSEKSLSLLLQNKTSKTNFIRCICRHETYFVMEVELGGYHFHVADYCDGTRIVTSLDGSARGLQGVAFRGILKEETRNVKWCGNYFVHYYPCAKVISYPNKQISELY